MRRSDLGLLTSVGLLVFACGEDEILQPGTEVTELPGGDVAEGSDLQGDAQRDPPDTAPPSAPPDTPPSTAPSDPCDPGQGNGPEGFYIEVESIDPVEPWTLDSSKSGFLGSGYFQWPYSHRDTRHGVDNSQSGVLSYDFEIGQPGTYRVEIRGRRDYEGWCADAENDACNDVWLAIGEHDFTKKMVKHAWGEWQWDGNWDPENGSPFRTEVELCTGTQTVQIAGRSNGVSIDAIRIYRNGSEAPSGP